MEGQHLRRTKLSVELETAIDHTDLIWCQNHHYIGPLALITYLLVYRVTELLYLLNSVRISCKVVV